MEPPVKRRKVRKGTHSCWECRRRKIRCNFAQDDEQVCLGCRERETPCISQESAPGPPPSSDRGVSERVRRLERMMEKLVEQTSTPPEDVDFSEDGIEQGERRKARGIRKSSKRAPAANTSTKFNAQDCKKPVDLLNSSAAGNALTALGHTSPNTPRLLTPATTPGGHPVTLETFPRPQARCQRLSRQLHALIPSRETLAALASKVQGVPFLFSIIHGPDPSQDGCPAARPEDILHIPPPTSPAPLLARKLLAVCFCLQQLPYDFDMSALHSPRSAIDIVNDSMALVTSEVTSNDDLLTCLEGIECLMLQGLIYSDAGLIRKAWMTGRRAISIQQLMGLDRRNNAGPIRSCDPDSDPSRRPPPGLLWSRAISANRYNSLVLGLPLCSRDNAFATKEFPEWDLSHDKLGRAYGVIAGRISERNDMVAQEDGSDTIYALTQAVDAELNAAAQILSDMWWDRPGAIRECSESDNFMPELSTLKLQVRHFTLLILLHLPYLLRKDMNAGPLQENHYSYNRKRCMEASRSVVRRFLEFRSSATSITSGRSVDYSALVASMTLVVAHAHLHDGEEQQKTDLALVEKARLAMDSTGKQWGDKLASESAELLGRLLLPTIAPVAGTSDVGGPATVGAPSGETPLLPCLLDSLTQPGSDLMNGTLDFLREGPTMMQADADWSWLGSSTDLDVWAFQGGDSTYWAMQNQEL